MHQPALRCALDTVGPGRVVLGSDYPFRGPVQRAVADVADAGFDKATQELILCGNAPAAMRSGLGVS